jgi:cytochrome c-type biogenesis protein CcmH
VRRQPGGPDYPACMRSGPIAVLVSVSVLLVPSAAGAQERASLPDIEDEVMCPICGTLLQLSDSPQAERERELIRRLIAEGRDKEQIKDALVAEYGEDVLATPDSSGFDLTAWVLPLLVLAGATLTAGVWLRRRTRPVPEPVRPLDPAEAERLDADLARHTR